MPDESRNPDDEPTPEIRAALEELHSRSSLEFGPSTRATWARFLNRFKDDLWPIFERHGFSLPEAVHCFLTSRLYNQLLDMEGWLIELNDETPNEW